MCFLFAYRKFQETGWLSRKPDFRLQKSRTAHTLAPMKKSVMLGILLACFFSLRLKAGEPDLLLQEKLQFHASAEKLQQDGKLIFAQAGWSQSLKAEFLEEKENSVSVQCHSDGWNLIVRAEPAEAAPTFYYAFRQMGFLFPHPRWQQSPQLANAATKVCGRKFFWHPRLRYRGFHLHTQHPSEWVTGFFEGKDSVAVEYLHWLARNQQNYFQLQMIRVEEKEFAQHWLPLQKEAHELGILTGLSVSFALHQQKSFALLSFTESILGKASEKLAKRLRELDETWNPDVFVFELGSTEFSSTDFEKTLSWINDSADLLAKKQIFIKVHASSGQTSVKFGNFNFLPARAGRTVGVLPHTVFLYGLESAHSPIYQRENFQDMKEFLQQEAKQRPTWYFPETSYYVGLDIDVPLFLPVYLYERARDMEILSQAAVSGQVVFTTGQEMGYWLLDWTIALWTDASIPVDPLAGMVLLGEDRQVWQRLMDWEKKFLLDQELISTVTTSIWRGVTNPAATARRGPTRADVSAPCTKSK